METVEKAPLTASRLRENIYKILDEVLETGIPAEIVRNGRTLRIVADDDVPKPSKLSRLTKGDLVIGDINDLIHLDWSHEWSELKPKTSRQRSRK